MNQTATSTKSRHTQIFRSPRVMLFDAACADVTFLQGKDFPATLPDSDCLRRLKGFIRAYWKRGLAKAKRFPASKAAEQADSLEQYQTPFWAAD